MEFIIEMTQMLNKVEWIYYFANKIKNWEISKQRTNWSDSAFIHSFNSFHCHVCQTIKNKVAKMKGKERREWCAEIVGDDFDKDRWMTEGMKFERNKMSQPADSRQLHQSNQLSLLFLLFSAYALFYFNPLWMGQISLKLQKFNCKPKHD